MSDNDLLSDIRERVIRIEERSRDRDARLDRMESMVSQLDRFRWWIIGSIGAAGTLGGAAAAKLTAVI